MQVWIASYSHRFGTNFAVFDYEPTIEECEANWSDEYEPDCEDEYIEISGPIDVETKKVRQ